LTRTTISVSAARVGITLGALVLAGLVARPGAFADETAGAGHDAHAHHHHPAPAGLQRSEQAYQVPEVGLIDQGGERVAMSALLATDKPILLNFIFTTCTAICPAMTATFEKVQEGLAGEADKVAMVSVSIDPEQDTPAALSEYAQRFDAGPQWVFLTGSLEDSIRVQKAFDAYRGDKMNHAPLTLLRAGPDAKWVRLDGFASATDLITELRAALGG
jgi:protein SCO1/2